MNQIWFSIIVVGILTYLSRLSFIMFLEKIRLYSLVLRAFKFIPIAVLTAIILPEIIKTGETISFVYPRVFASLFAICISWRTKNVILTIISGMAMLYLVQYLMNYF